MSGAREAVTAGDLLTLSELRALRRLSAWRGAALVLHAWAVIAGAMLLHVAWPSVLTLLVAVVIIGARQLGLAILMHEAAHWLFFRGQWANNRLGAWLCAYPLLADLPRYRRRHHRHHRHTGPLIANAVLFGGLAALGHWSLYLLLWVLPLATWYQLLTRLRNAAEHAGAGADEPLRHTRTTGAGPIARACLAPYWMNYHLEHHLLVFVPCWRLPDAHALLLAKGYGPSMELASGYLEAIRRATTSEAVA